MIEKKNICTFRHPTDFLVSISLSLPAIYDLPLLSILLCLFFLSFLIFYFAMQCENMLQPSCLSYMLVSVSLFLWLHLLHPSIHLPIHLHSMPHTGPTNEHPASPSSSSSYCSIAVVVGGAGEEAATPEFLLLELIERCFLHNLLLHSCKLTPSSMAFSF